MEKVFKAIGIISLVIVSLILSGLWGAFVFTKLWAWFIVPLEVVQISLFHAWGLGTLITFLKTDVKDYIGQKKEEEDLEYWANYALMVLILPLLALGIGFIVKGFM